MTQGLLEIFVVVDDFCQIFEKVLGEVSLPGRPKPIRSSLCPSEIVTILIYFQLSGFKSFKKYYENLIQCNKKEFPKLVSYNRFVELQSSSFLLFVSVF